MPCTPKVLLVILNHNSLKSLGQDSIKFLRSILSTDYPALEVVIVDNASSDGSDVVIEQELKAVGKGRLIKLKSNLGYAGGNNYGFKMFGGDCKYVAFLNNDIEVEPDWLKKY
jgi:GT2 family glycosyltransferase